MLLLDFPQYGHRELRPVVCPYNMKTPAEESIAVSLIPDDTHFLCIKDFICWKKPVFPQTFVPLHLVGVTDSFVRFFTHKDTKNQRHLQFFMPYIYLIVKHITKQKRNKKQHFVAPKFAQNPCQLGFWLRCRYLLVMRWVIDK